MKMSSRKWVRRGSRIYIFDESDLENMLDRLKRFGDLVRDKHLLTTTQIGKRLDRAGDRA